MAMQKHELRRLINNEHGIDYCYNVDLGGYIFYLGDSFLAFEFCNVNGFTVVRINYIFITSKTALLKLFGQAIEFWKGYGVNYIYYQTHKRKANVAEKFLENLGLKVIENNNFNDWKHEWTSTNGFPEKEILEAITDR